MSYKEMSDFLLKNGICEISSKTIGIYCNTLYKHDYFSLVTDYIYEAYVDREKIRINREEYNNFYKFFYNGIEEKMKMNEKMIVSLDVFGYSSPPRKRPKIDVLMSVWDEWNEILIPDEEKM